MKEEIVVRNTPAKYKTKILWGAVILALVVAFFFARLLTKYAFDLFIGFIMIFAAFEIENLMRKMDRPSYMIAVGGYPVVAFAMTILAVNMGYDALTYILLMLIALVAMFVLCFVVPLCFPRALRTSRRVDGYDCSLAKYSLIKSLNSMFIMIWPSMLLGFAFAINHFTELGIAQDSALFSYQNVDIGLLGLVMLFATTMFADTFAMVFGRLIKGHKINLKRLGPGKSWAGLIFGIIGGCLAGIIVFLIFNNIKEFQLIFNATTISLNIWHFAVGGVICGICTMIGDVFSSFFKREAQVKDFSTMIPGHGGVMDRVNGLLVNSVAVFLLMSIFIVA